MCVLQILEKGKLKMISKSKFGFHPCDRETFKKLKTLHKFYWQTLHDYANWVRWDRKEPQNRVIKKYFRTEDGERCGSEIVGPRPEPTYCKVFEIIRKGWGVYIPSDMGIIESYHNARMPKSDKESVKPLKLSEAQIDKLYQSVLDYFK